MKQVRICSNGHHNDASLNRCLECGATITYVDPVSVPDGDDLEEISPEQTGPTFSEPRKTSTLQRIKLISKKDGFVIEIPTIGGVIGREGDLEPNYFDVNSNDLVSRRHARIFLEGLKYFIIDEGSHNGTTYNKQPLSDGKSLEITVGSSIVFANMEFQVQEL